MFIDSTRVKGLGFEDICFVAIADLDSYVFVLLWPSTMAVRGVWQLQKLIVCLCDHSGSSAGARDFVARLFPSFQKQNPQFELTTRLVRGHHPHLRGLYVNRNERVVDVKNQNAEDIMTQIMRLRNSTGRKVVKLKTRHVTFNPSIQGTWTPELKV